MNRQNDQAVEKLKATGRLYYLDWLRIIAILAVFFIHSAKIFDFHTTDLFNQERSAFWSAFREFNLVWIMPLFFIISGGAAFFSLNPGKVGGFLKTRVKRLLVPLLFVGTFLINPLYVYALRLFAGQADGNFFVWYPNFFKGVFGFGGNFAPLGNGTHLWYLEFLLLYSLLLLPFFIRSKKRIASGAKRFSNRFERPWTLLILFAPVSISGAAFVLAGLGGVRVMGGWDPVSYLLFLAYGYMIFSNQRIMEVIHRIGPACLAAAVLLTALHLDSHFGFNLVIPGVTRHDMAANGALRPLDLMGWALVQAFRGLLVWCWILGLLGTGSRFINFNNRFLAYANQAVLPFYILHHSVILLVGGFVVDLQAGIQVKFILIFTLSFAIVVLVYELLVRRLGVLRFLFGMKKMESVKTP